MANFHACSRQAWGTKHQLNKKFTYGSIAIICWKNDTFVIPFKNCYTWTKIWKFDKISIVIVKNKTLCERPFALKCSYVIH